MPHMHIRARGESLSLLPQGLSGRANEASGSASF